MYFRNPLPGPAKRRCKLRSPGRKNGFTFVIDSSLFCDTPFSAELEADKLAGLQQVIHHIG